MRLPTAPVLLADGPQYSLRLLDATLVGGLVGKISDWEPEASPVPDATLDSRLREGNTYLEHSAALGVSLDSGRCVRNHRSSWFLIHRWLHDLVNMSWREDQSGSR